MSVALIPKSKDGFEMEVANGTWFTLLNTAGLGTVVNPKNTNDPIVATAQQANRCATLLEKWTPPAGWYISGSEEEGKETFILFFESCGGFESH